MRIGLDVSAALAGPSGVRVYIERLMEGLAAVDRLNEYVAYAAFWRDPARLVALEVPRAPNFRVESRRVPQRWLLRADEWGLGLQERWFRGWGVDLFHGMGGIVPPLRRLPSVVTVHHVGGVGPETPEWDRFYFGELVARSARRADAVIAVSEHSRREVLAEWAPPPERVFAVHEGGPHPDFRPRDGRRGPAGAPYVLHLGSFHERKNLPRLVEAFHRWLSRDPSRPERLVLAGRPGPDLPRVEALARDLKLTGRLTVKTEVARAEAVKLYQDAAMVVVPSLQEGFGFPVLEAMACGAPVLASNVASLPEVAGDAALLFDPLDVDALSKGLEKVAKDADYADELRRRGRERSRHFTWEQSARRTLEVYRKAAARRDA